MPDAERQHHQTLRAVDETRANASFTTFEQLQRVQMVTDAALASLTVDDLLDELLIRVREALSADTAAILLFDEERAELVARAAKGLEEEVKQGVRIPAGQGFAGTIASSGEPLAILDVDHSIVMNPILRERGVRSLLGVPLVVQGQTLGVLHVGTLQTRHFGTEDAALLQLVGDRVALAIHAGLYERERAVARTLQRSFLPERPPSVPGLEFAVRYLPATGRDVGGDWYDTFQLPNGSVAVAIGDVVGRGLVAASTMGGLRNSLRAYAMDMVSPGEVLNRLNRLLAHFDTDHMATLLYGTIDPVRMEFRFATAGHIPPFVRDPDGSVRILEADPGPPLGAVSFSSYSDNVETLPGGAQMVLCTDGLIERRGESLEVGMERMREACIFEGEPDDLCDEIIRRLLEDVRHDDDVALLVIRTAQALPDRVSASFPADARQLVSMRRLLQRWLNDIRIEPELRYAVLAASGEAAANAVEHAYGPAGGQMQVTGEASADSLTVTVRDFGAWRASPRPDRGQGIPLMEAFTDRVTLSRSPGGTVVKLKWRRPLT